MLGKLKLVFRVDGLIKKTDLNDVNMEWEVSFLRKVAGDAQRIPMDDIELTFRGQKLNDSFTLSAAGVRPGVTIHIVKRKVPEVRTLLKEAELLTIISSFRNIMKNPAHKSVFLSLSSSTVLKQILAVVPRLREDPVAIALIKEPESLLQLLDLKLARKTFLAHPALAEAATHIISYVYRTLPNLPATFTPGTAAGAAGAHGHENWGADYLSEDDDMDDSGPDQDSQDDDSLARFLVPIRQQGENSSSAAGSSRVITSQMLGNALNAALASTENEQLNPDGPSVSQPTDSLTREREASLQLQLNLAQMHELGLRDDVLNLQALQACDMNVQDAINLVLSGGMFD